MLLGESGANSPNHDGAPCKSCAMQRAMSGQFLLQSGVGACSGQHGMLSGIVASTVSWSEWAMSSIEEVLIGEFEFAPIAGCARGARISPIIARPDNR